MIRPSKSLHLLSGMDMGIEIGKKKVQVDLRKKRGKEESIHSLGVLDMPHRKYWLD